MSALHSLIESITALTPLEKLGWVLLQSLWQQALVAIVLWLVLMLLRGRPAQARYIFACAALAIMALLPAATAALALLPRHAHADSFVPAAHEFTPPVSDSSPTFARPAQSAFAWINLYRCASWAWFVGVCWFSLWNLLGWLKVYRLSRSARPAPVPWQAKLAELAKTIGATCRTSIGISPGVAAPSVIGWLRPLVLVPASALSELPATYLEALLLHELAHIRRHDYLINLFQIAIETLFFYHPAVWWVSSRIRTERENCCDDMAVSHCGSADLYVRALAAMEEIRLGPIAAFAMASTGGSLLKRIERLIGRTSSREKRRPSPFVGAAGLALLAAIALARHPAVTHAVASPTTTAPAPAADANTMDTVHPEDLEPGKPVDYRIGPNDLLSITIAGLNSPTSESQKAARVSESGNISMPYLKAPIHVAGQTDFEAEQSIIKAYRDENLIEHANVSVAVMEAQGRIYFIGGAINRPGAFHLGGSNLRLLDAIWWAGGTTTSNIRFIRVRRRLPDGNVRTIDIPPDALLAGDKNVNLVIRGYDLILIITRDLPHPALIVHLAVGQDSILLDGKHVTWAELERELSGLPDRQRTVLQIAPASPDITVGRFLDAQRRAEELVDKLRLQNLQPMMGEPGH